MAVKKWLAGLALLAMSAGVTAHQHWQSVEIKSQQLGEGIYVVFGEGGNIAVSLGEDGTLMVDDQYAQLSDRILAEVAELGGSAPRFLVNTHWHLDHTGGNENLAKRGAVIIAHDQVRAQMEVENKIEALGVSLPPSPQEALPVITYDDDLRLHFNGETVAVVHLPPAHTDGDSVVRFVNANILHTGDIWFNGFYPFIDVEHGGSLAGMVAAAGQIIAMVDSDTVIIPGHGPVGNSTDLMAYREMLQKVMVRLQGLKAEGLSLQQVIEQKPLADLDDEWGDGFLSAEKWLGIVYPGIE